MTNEVLEVKIENLEKEQKELKVKIDECMDLKSTLLLLNQTVNDLKMTVNKLSEERENKFSKIDGIKYTIFGGVILFSLQCIIKYIFKI